MRLGVVVGCCGLGFVLFGFYIVVGLFLWFLLGVILKYWLLLFGIGLEVLSSGYFEMVFEIFIVLECDESGKFLSDFLSEENFFWGF